MDCIVQRDSTFEEFLISWAQYSTAIIAFAESHKSNKELKRCFRDDEDDPDADSEHTITMLVKLQSVCLLQGPLLPWGV